MREIKNLVFEGGGVLGMAYVGALVELEEQKILNNVERVAGTSAGALFALLVSLKYDSAHLKKVIEETDFKHFEDRFDPLRVVSKYGIYKGDVLLSFIESLIKDVTNDPSVTFEQLKQQGYHELKVFACNLNTTQIQEFSYEETPHAVVAHAVRASMSIPLFFSAWQFPNNYPNDHIYVDGGTMYNYPINAFENYSNTLGFFFNTDDGKTISTFGLGKPIHYAESIFKALLQSQKINFYKNNEEVDVTVFIDTHGISPTDFKLTASQKQLLFESGRNATRSYLTKMMELQ